MKKKSDILSVKTVCRVLAAFMFSLFAIVGQGSESHRNIETPLSADIEAVDSELLTEFEQTAQQQDNSSTHELSIGIAPSRDYQPDKKQITYPGFRGPGTGFGWNAASGTSGIPTGPVEIDIPGGVLTNIHPVPSTDIWMSGADFANGIWYAVSHASTALSGLYNINQSNGDYTLVYSYPDLVLTGLAYDEVNKVMYASEWDLTNEKSVLHTIDLSNGDVHTIGFITDNIVIGLAADYKGNLFGITLNDNSLYSIDKATGSGTWIGDLGVNINYAQDIGYDRDNCKLYGTLYYDDGTGFTGGLFEICTVNGTASLLNNFIAEVTAFGVPYYCSPFYCNHEILLSHPTQSGTTLSEICSGDAVHFRIVNQYGQDAVSSSIATTIDWYYSDDSGSGWNFIAPPVPPPPSALFTGFAFVSPPGHDALSIIPCSNHNPGFIDRIYRAVITVTDGINICEYVAESPVLRICCPVLNLSLSMTPSHPTVLCEGDDVTFTASVTYNLPAPDAGNFVTINWFEIYNGATTPLPAFTNEATINYSTTLTDPGRLYLRAVVENCGCSPVTVQKYVNIDPKPVCGTITGASTNLVPTADPWFYYICPGNDAAIAVDAPFSNCNPQWQFMFPVVGVWQNLGFSNITQKTNILPQEKPPGSPYLWPIDEECIVYRIECLPLSYPNSGCPPCLSNELTICLHQKPVISGTQTVICQNDHVTLEVSNNILDDDYDWYHNGVYIGSGSTIQASLAGCYSVSPANCSTVISDLYCIEVCNVVATISCPTPDCPCIGDPIILSAGASSSTCGGTLTYAWSWDSGTLIADNGETIEHIPDPAGTTYTVIVTDAHGCTGTAVRTVVPCDCDSQAFVCGNDVTFTYRNQQVTYGTIERGGLCWMDRNLGADPMPFIPGDDATGNTDTRLYGDLFQWGRLDDGHQDRTSGTTPGPINQDVPGHGNFITLSTSPFDWRLPQNNALWQGEDGINNPCPPGWRVPSEDELNAERLSWGSNNSAGAYASTLKWPVGGYRTYNGMFYYVGSYGFVWSSSVSGTDARSLSFGSGLAYMYSHFRAVGMSVRCVRDN